MSAEEFILIIFIGCVSIMLTWVTISESRRKKALAKARKKPRHLKVIK